MSTQVRVVSDADLEQAGTVFRTTLVGAGQVPSVDLTTLREPGRTLAAFIDDELVGTVNSYPARLTVPGGARVPHAAVTHVGVLPTHTRRGIATALMRAQLEDLAGRGEIVATLRASEAVIYERFGFGIATSAIRFDLVSAQVRFRENVPTGGPIRLVEPVNDRSMEKRVYAAGPSWTGAIDRYHQWWRMGAARAPEIQYLAVHGAPGAEDGFVRYRPATTGEAWFTGTKTIIVDDLFAATDEAYAALVRYLTSIDLVAVVRFGYQPLDTPLRAMITDLRALTVTGVDDETWLRLIDVPAALAQRTYDGEGEIVIEVTDNLLPANSGRYAVSSKGAVRTDSAADLSLDVATLGALYLGGSRWWHMARAGRVVEHTTAATNIADNLFRTNNEPFCGTYF